MIIFVKYFFDIYYSGSSKFGPDFKVLYLARDPRGSINSLLQSPETERNIKFTNITFSCHRLYTDILALEILMNTPQIKHRIKVVRYEDLVRYPKKMAKNMYSFIGATKFVESAEEYINEHQMNDLDLSRYYVFPKKLKYRKSSSLD